MHKSNIDIAVLLIFFARPEQTLRVFEQIKIARPSQLFLYQDGAREGHSSDVEGIDACRKIVEDIDWECVIHRWYQEKNVGCDPSEYYAQKWMFQYVNKGIILEDDDVPSQSFFPFCKELLDKYENDLRICMISGYNIMDTVNVEADYWFSSRGPIWGWATWKRTIDSWDSTLSWMDDNETVAKLRANGTLTNSAWNTYIRHRASGREHYEDFISSTRMINGQLSIIPSKNLINNIGVAVNSTHTAADMNQMSKRQKSLYEKKVFDYKFPLKHPKYIFDDKALTAKLMSWLQSSFLERISNKLRKGFKTFKLK
ncbi:hemolysin activation protein [Bacteroides sp.]|uniref:hemolysin activation protein n=1 Tax=Bacteroides sp. TaxID=29523 RepID=UPI00261F409D|nr:hemolysin activation protein [Bacteroides sp.]